jgi:hypothetical protein
MNDTDFSLRAAAAFVSTSFTYAFNSLTTAFGYRVVGGGSIALAFAIWIYLKRRKHYQQGFRSEAEAFPGFFKLGARRLYEFVCWVISLCLLTIGAYALFLDHKG